MQSSTEGMFNKKKLTNQKLDLLQLQSDLNCQGDKRTTHETVAYFMRRLLVAFVLQSLAEQLQTSLTGSLFFFFLGNLF